MQSQGDDSRSQAVPGAVRGIVHLCQNLDQTGQGGLHFRAYETRGSSQGSLEETPTTMVEEQYINALIGWTKTRGMKVSLYPGPDYWTVSIRSPEFTLIKTATTRLAALQLAWANRNPLWL